ncbi:1-acyl-sn-glycerol-3-phosphate acyltransferase delta-like protein, partial [Leptotrombidium deliense]
KVTVIVMGVRSYVKLLFAIFLAIIWLFDGLILNLIQFIAFVTIRPFSRTLFRRINYYLTYASWSQLVALAEWWADSKLTMYFANEDTEKHFLKEHGLAVMNHRYEVDWLYGWLICDKYNSLGSAKTYAKKSLKWIPVIGWGWQFCEMIFLERSWEKDSLILANSIDTLLEYPHNFLLLLFAEGTRYTSEKYEASVQFAKQRGLKPLKHHLQPRTRGFVFTINHSKDRLPAMYNVQLSFRHASPSPNLTSILKGNSIHGHAYFERIPLNTIPTDSEESIAQFLYDLYQKKDQLTDYFNENGKFPGKVVVKERRKAPLLNGIFSFGLIMSIFCYVLYSLYLSKSYTILVIVLSVYFAALFSVVFLIRSTKAKKGSSYGKIKGNSSPVSKTIESCKGDDLSHRSNGSSLTAEVNDNENNAVEAKKDL